MYAGRWHRDLGNVVGVNDTDKYYDTMAPALCRRYEEAVPAEPLALVSSVMPRNGHILEMGCGSARDGALLFTKGFRWWGLDRSSAMVCEAIHLHPILRGRIMLADLRQPMPFAPGTFTGAFSFATFMHLEADCVSRTLGQLNCILQDGAPFVMSVPSHRPDVDANGISQDGRYFLPWLQGQWIKVLASAGFEVERCHHNSDSLSREITWLNIVARTGMGGLW